MKRRDGRKRAPRASPAPPAWVTAAVLAFTCVAGGASLPTLDVQGHRGCRGLLPENTLPAFRRALELGVTTLEMDLQLTQDRVVIVAHDPGLDPAYCRREGGGKVPDAPFDQLRLADLEGIDCGSVPRKDFPEQRPVPGARIPTLDEVLDLARAAPYPVRVSVEMKAGSPRQAIPLGSFAELVVAALRRHGMEGRAIVQSFDPAALRAVRELAPGIARAILVRDRESYDALLESSAATILSPRFTDLRRDDVRRMRARGVKVIPWTVNEPADIRRMVEWGVDGIISDYPDRVLALRGGSPPPTAPRNARDPGP